MGMQARQTSTGLQYSSSNSLPPVSEVEVTDWWCIPLLRRSLCFLKNIGNFKFSRFLFTFLKYVNKTREIARTFLKMSIKLATTQGHFKKNVLKTCQNYLFRRIFRRILPAADITLLLEPLGIFSFKSGGLLDTLLSLGECLLFNSVSSSEDSVMLKSLKFSGSGLLRTWPLLTGWYWLMMTLLTPNTNTTVLNSDIEVW